MKIKSVEELYSYLSNGGIFEKIDNKGLCEVTKNEVYIDSDFESFLFDELEADYTEFDEFIIIFDTFKTIEIIVPIINIENRHDPYCGNETIVKFEEMQLKVFDK